MTAKPPRSYADFERTAFLNLNHALEAAFQLGSRNHPKLPTI